MSATLTTPPWASSTTPRSAPVEAILPPRHGRHKKEDEQECESREAEDNLKPRGNVKRERLKAAAHANPLVSGTSESEGIPETLYRCISKDGAPMM
jgi:hypothetical protein